MARVINPPWRQPSRRLQSSITPSLYTPDSSPPAVNCLWTRMSPYGSTPCISHVNSMWFCVKHMWNTRKNVCFTCIVRNTHENTCGTHVSATNSTCEPHDPPHVVHMWNLWRSHVFHMCFHVYFGQNM